MALADGDTATASDVIIHSACQGQGPGVTLAASEGPGSCPRQGHYQAPPVLGMDPAPILESGCPAPTFRAKAAVHIVLLTQVADPQVGTGVHAGRAALQVHHVARTALGWKERRCELAQQAGRQGLPCSPGVPQAPGWPWCLPQKEAVLQLPGRPPAWEHWREYSATELHTQLSAAVHWQRSRTQASTYSSSGMRSRQSSKAATVSRLSHSARWERCEWAAACATVAFQRCRDLPPRPADPQNSTPLEPVPPTTHVLRAGLGLLCLLGILALCLGLVDLLHVPELDGTEGYTWPQRSVVSSCHSPPTWPVGPDQASAHLPTGIPSRSAARCSHHTAHRCGFGTCCPAPAVGTGSGR